MESLKMNTRIKFNRIFAQVIRTGIYERKRLG